MQADAIMRLAEKGGALRSEDLKRLGMSRTMLSYLTRQGKLRRVSRGTYILVDQIPERAGFFEVAAAAPHAVICLLSALQYHEVTTQMPNETWVAIRRGTRKPAASGFKLKVVKFSGAMFSSGIIEQTTNGITIRVYSPAKTVVDCFRFRNRIGLDVAREALMDTLQQGKATRDEIWQFARVCRMLRVMRPYLEMAK